MTEKELNSIRDSIGAMIRKRRQELRLSHRQVARIAGVHHETIINAEHGRNWIGLKQWVKILDALGLYNQIKSIRNANN